MQIDTVLYDSCQDYVDRLIKKKLTQASRAACDGLDEIRELCEKCPYYRLAKADTKKVK